MKRFCLLLCTSILLLTSAVSYAQISKLSELASGKLRLFSPIREFNGDIYGYWALYELGKINAEEEKYEYVILDKNLNKVANGIFTDELYPKVYTSYYAPQKVGDDLIFSKRFTDARTFSSLNPLYTLHRKINVKTNEVSDVFYVENGNLMQGPRKVKKSLSRDMKNAKALEFPIAYKDGFFMYEVNRIVGQPKNKFKSVNYYGLDNEKRWSFVYNKYERDLDVYFDVMDKDHLILTVNEEKENLKKIQKINPENGELLFTYYLENKESVYNHVFDVEQLNDKTIIVGKISQFNAKGYNYKKALGLFKIELNEKGEEISKKYFKWNEAATHIKINEKGKVDGGYRLIAKSYFVFKDGSISVLMEKFKSDIQLGIIGSNVAKTEDFVLMNFDKDFKLQKVHTLDKEKSKNSATDYLYSQYINDKEGVVFFYQDQKRETQSKKDWVLGIVSIINGAITHETIPITSKEHVILPYIAKEGYILLREFNKNEAYNQIRLERLNY